MAVLKNSVMLVVATAVVAVLADPQGGRNQYLPPPSQGYTYTSPSVPFQTPTTSKPYRPPTQSTTYRPPTQRPTTYAPIHSTILPEYTIRPTQRPTPPPHVPHGPHEHDHSHHEPGMPFDFQYAVKDDQYGTDYSHNAISNGDVVQGEYRVQLPDGRLQIVRYTADWATGFHADVQYEGEPRYDQNKGGNYVGPAPTYPQGRPGGGY